MKMYVVIEENENICYANKINETVMTSTFDMDSTVKQTKMCLISMEIFFFLNKCSV